VEAEGASWSVAQVVERAAVVAVVAQALYWFLLEGSGSPAGRLNAALEGVGSKRSRFPGIENMVPVGQTVVDGPTTTEFRERRPGDVIGSDGDPPPPPPPPRPIPPDRV
jgi:hypothetical protein